MWSYDPHCHIRRASKPTLPPNLASASGHLRGLGCRAPVPHSPTPGINFQDHRNVFSTDKYPGRRQLTKYLLSGVGTGEVIEQRSVRALSCRKREQDLSDPDTRLSTCRRFQYITVRGNIHRLTSHQRYVQR